MPKTNKSKYAIMGMLGIRPMSGYDMKKLIAQSISYFWNESFGQIYPTLKKLVEEGLATRQTEKRLSKLDRYVYTLTDAGRTELRNWLKEPPEPESARNEFLLKLFFASQVAVGDNIALIEGYRREQVALLEYCRQMEQFLRTERADSPNLPYWLLGLDLGRQTTQATIAWCDKSIEEINQLANDESTRDDRGT